MKIVAGIVLYNPEINRLMENIACIYKQVDKVLLVDNNSNNIEGIKKSINLFIKQNNISNTFFKIIYNKKNEGIAYALNEILNYAYDNKYEWFITLDQDSIARDKLIENYKKYINVNKIAMMTCVIRDRNFSEIHFPKNNFEYISRCITSGAFNNTEILKKIGGFDNYLFIDSVDFDICAMIIENGYKIIKINYEGLLHEVGHAIIVRPFLRREFVYNHSPQRVYYIIRNSIILMKKHRSLNNMKNKIKLKKRKYLILRYQNNREENKLNIKNE